MGNQFHQKRCRSVPEFEREVKLLVETGDPAQEKDTWIFRGQQKAEWPLRTTLERECERFGVEGSCRETIERRMMREFRRRLHHYTSDVPGREELDEWMALMQHHGAPTRLLDFTYSSYVAAYFAFEKARPNTEAAVWAVNTDCLARKLTKRSPDLAAQYSKYRRDGGQQAFKDVFVSEERTYTSFALGATPFRLNERLAYQRGASMCPGNVSEGFMDNLSEIAGRDDIGDTVIKFIISIGDHQALRSALERLDDMNINRVTLFPGMDGFSQSFGPRIPFFLKMKWP